MQAPADALAEALPLVAANLYHKAEPLLKQAASDPQIRHWALLGHGKAEEGEKKYDKAAVYYRQISKTSAASIDANLALFRLSLVSSNIRDTESQALLGKNSLEEAIHKAERMDLLPELSLLHAATLERNKQFKQAYGLYQQVRRKFLKDKQACAQAKLAQASLRANGKHLPTFEELLDEVKLLTSEGASDEALDKISKAKKNISLESENYAFLLLAEEKARRRLGENKEADMLLATVSADGEIGTADIALLKMAKNAWNSNEQGRALGFLENFESRFKKSPVYAESRYITGRVLEEQNRLPHAAKEYRSIVAMNSNSVLKLKALRQLAWISMRLTQYKNARNYFSKIESDVFAKLEHHEKQRVVDENNPSKIVLLKALVHAQYWKAQAELKELSVDHVSDKKDKLNTLFTDIINKYPQSYYAMLSSKRAEMDKLASSKREVSYNPDTKACNLEIPGELRKRLEILNLAGLREYTRKELNWYFYQGKESSKAALVQSFQSEVLAAASKAKIYSELGDAKSSIRYAKRALSLLEKNSDECRQTLLSLSYPIPHQDLFASAAKTHHLPLPLLLAVSRTESHFDPTAKSVKDAVGLLQLLPSTAEKEGLKENESLYQPNINIDLGAKHLAGLLKKYKGERVFAIAAYNAGSSAVDRWRKRYSKLSPQAWVELIGYPETKNYVKKVLSAEQVYQEKLGSSLLNSNLNLL